MELIIAKISAAGVIYESEIIKYILNEDINSLSKREMEKGRQYYNSQHDVLEKNFNERYIEETETETTETTDGYEKEKRKVFKNPNRSNHHDVHSFHKLLVDQKVSYVVGREPTISVKGADDDSINEEYEAFAADIADENFDEMLQKWVKGASNKGYEVLHFYYDDDGKLNYCIVPAEEIIPIYDSEYQKNLEEVIRYYTVSVIKNGQTYRRRKVEWWKKDGVTYYTEKEKDVFVRDNRDGAVPHWWSINLLNGTEKRREPMSWGRVPFIILENNSARTTDLLTNKSLIDAYDLISSEGTNNLLDLVDLYWVIQGYGGETAGAIARKLQINRAVNISDSSGKVEARQVSLPVNERIEWLNMLRRDIYHFGMGIDIDDERFGNAPSGVSLKFRYANLKHKCELMTPSLKKCIKDFYWFITEDYNRKNGTAYDSSLIKVTLNYSQIANDLETVQILTQSEGIISKKTQLENHPLVTDVNEELEQLKAEEKENAEKYGSMTFVPPKAGDTGEQ